MAGIADCLSAINFAQHDTVVAAVSGGSDSTALLVLICEFLKANASSVRLVAVTVDHGLRPESADEAGQVAEFCKRLGAGHVVKRWSGLKPSSGIQAAAREARYDLLTEAAAELGAGLILTGHTRDDQLETVLMRKERGEGPGLAGIAPATLAFRDYGRAPIWFARPFLNESRLELRDKLTRRGIIWIDDPSNANPDFERVRVREKIAALDTGTIATLSEEQLNAAHYRHDMSARAGALIRNHVSKAALGLYLIDPGIAQERDIEAAAGALRIVMAFAGGAERMIEEGAARVLLKKIHTGEPFRTTGSRALIDFRKEGLFILREDRDVRLTGGIFDNRYAVLAGTAEPVQTEIRPALPRSLLAQAERHQPPPTLQIIRRLLNPWPKRAPLFDLPAASALAHLASEPAFPPAPCSL
jgi:tRNA(Ile)-lysidine synthase